MFALLLLYLAVALGFSFFCSIAEAVLLSVRPAYVASLEEKGAAGSKALARLRDNLDRPLAAILTLNTIAHTVGAAGVGAEAAAVFGSGYVGVTSAVLTFLILVFSEIIPKTLGATYWPQLAPVMAPMIEALVVLLWPFVWMSRLITRLLARGGESAFTFSRDELKSMAEIGAREGHIDTKELRIVTNLMRLHRLSVRDIMTPRPVMVMVPEGMSVRAFFEAHADVPFSRLAVYGDNRDDVTGYVMKDDLLIAQAADEFERRLAEFKRGFPTIPDQSSVSEVFERLVRERWHIAFVLDEYGTVQGLVTLEDVVETLIGLEITDEHDTVENMQALAHDRWRSRVSALGINPESLGGSQ
ncbi:hemolysin [Rhodothalassium salexigens]|uniref:hemolysin family protein n=1 Tax=Rhodothalassium salexigens TaxID=1086 RepID=UPI001912E4A1|nr:hemolysin family protein [Rhodothalassium salexigens]MBK5911007.1 hemolysin [Rhodothalassium salexigens]MBK5921782.1 hemolysin [Rhodothalassium salexigens]